MPVFNEAPGFSRGEHVTAQFPMYWMPLPEFPKAK
jgi:putative NADPH-quinone reductase